MNTKRAHIQGFTLLEVLLSFAAIAVIAGISIPAYQVFQVRNDLDIAATTLVQTLRRAQLLSQALDNDASWGVALQAGSTTLFQGASYASRDPAFDEVFEVPLSIVPSGLSEVVFLRFTSLPGATGTVTFTSNANEARVVTINEKGMVEY
jgi:type II secretory pathway pseudopilin PulG